MATDNELADAFTKGLAPVFTGFRRKGRRWARTNDGILYGVGVYRTRFSIGTCATLRLLPFARPEKGSVELETSLLSEWHLYETAEAVHELGPDSQLHSAIRQACAVIEVEAMPWLQTRSSQEGFIAAVSTQAVSRQLDASLAFGRLSEVSAFLALGPPPSRDAVVREFDLADIDVALRGYQALGVPPSADWLEFATRTVRAFRGRPRKSVRPLYLSVRQMIDDSGLQRND
jgi:hypothetical protein